ncbi:Txe/YoeB family addiction module toxin [Paraburkholderia dipogonis]|uniref:Txe/YoeB family addiction module toxin n=1 Tax=Paraburkholderia dipogonis TaxID=1211383 RepID=UPI0038BC5096
MARGIIFSPNAWDQYLHWLNTDSDIHEKLLALLKECQRDLFKGTGKPEPLKNELKGWWSRRISGEHRLVYCGRGGSDGYVEIAQCRYHYSK